MNTLRQIIQESLILAENIQQADKLYFNKGLLSPRVKEVLLRITGGDALTKIMADIYYAEVQQQHRQGKMVLAMIDDEDDGQEEEDDGGHQNLEDDVMRREDWERIKAMYQQLKAYNKNVFPIKGYNPNGVADIWELIRALKQRATILEEMKKLPSIAIRNMKDDIRQERDASELQHYRSRLEYFLAQYSQLSNREGRFKSNIDKKMFRAGITLEDLVDFAEEKENLIGGRKLNKSIVKKIVNEYDYELQIVYEKGDVMIVDVTGEDGIKALGCNSVWCFTYGSGNKTYNWRGQWEQNSTNNHAYVIIDFTQESDSPWFMYVVIKPLDFNSVRDENDEDKANANKMADMANNYEENPLEILSNFLSLQEAYMILNFGEYREGPKSAWPYQDPNQLKLDLKEIRKIIRETLESKSDKGNRYFEMLKTAMFQHYDSPKGELSTFTHGEEDRKRLVSKLSDADKKQYREWLKTPEGQASIEMFEKNASPGWKKENNKGELNENKFVVDKYGDTLKVDKAWSGFDFPVPEYKTKVKDSLVHIITNTRGISEKSFSAYDEVIKEVGDYFKANKEAVELINDFENKNLRPEYAAETLFSKFGMRKSLNEARKSKFEKLKDNKIPLTPEERKKVMDAGAVWHFSPGNKPSPAVWKSKDKNGKITYVTDTHRAYQDRPTLKGAISIFHSFIKGTA